MAVLKRLILFLLLSTSQVYAINAITASGGLDSAEVMQVVKDSLSMGMVINVDTTTVVTGDVLVYNGTWWVGAQSSDTSFIFSINTFTDNASSLQLIGNTDWKWLDVGDISFSASYLNGPATICTVQVYGTGIANWSPALTLASCSGPTTNTDTVDYPAGRGCSATFRLIAGTSGGDWDTAYTSVNFWNYIFYGGDTDSTPNEAAIEALTNDLDNDHTQTSFSITGMSATEHVIFACPAGMSNLSTNNFGYGDETSDDGNYRLTLPVTLVDQTLSITNSAGEVENYDVYSSNLEFPQGDATTTLRTTNALRNRIKWGVVTDTVNMDEADIHALATDSVISNDETRVFTVTANANEYIAYAWPTRLGTVAFWVGGFEGGFQDPKTIAVTNANSYTENYYLAQSENHSLGTTEVETK